MVSTNHDIGQIALYLRTVFNTLMVAPANKFPEYDSITEELFIDFVSDLTREL